MRKVFIRETKLEMPQRMIVETGNWLGPYLFHEWGSFSGNSMAILENMETGECMMAPPGQMKFEAE